MNLNQLLDDVKEILAADGNYDQLSNKEIYTPSIQVERRNVYFILHQTDSEGIIQKSLVVYENRLTAVDFDADDSLTDVDSTLLVGQLNEKNNDALAKRFQWMRPTSRRNYKYTFGLGDRLGNASNAHLRLFKGRGIMPVLAQQSIRELVLMHRTNTDVFQSASWAVFEEGFTYGWGADGDHVKTPYEVDYAVKIGCSMITLDCTEEINNDIVNLKDDELDKRFNALDSDQIQYFNETYLNKSFDLGNGRSVKFAKHDVEESVLTFYDAILFAAGIYKKFVVPYNLDFEISMDETPYQTTNPNHFFFANELHRRGITPTTMAPRFYGEFQKAIDYIGDTKRFEREYIIHEAIAEHFGYKLSIHSGSDKLSVYEIIGRISKDHGWHVKTAGTNWLEALRVIAHKDPKFMLELYKFAYENLDDVKDFYVFNAQTDGTAPKPETMTTENVMDLLDNDDARQVLHTMYGSIMNLKHNYHYVYRDKFWNILLKNQALYDRYLNIHIAEHLDLLQGIVKTKEEAQEKNEPKTDISKESSKELQTSAKN
ncbi:tagaturonate epimerase family protein [Lentilactobacillus diolivorans]|uniref:tagaturonate epimerase family protein n=1 Tax=Lentilactobacillus diolivorans TaxID=179838 RepID=UPI002468937E|nr:tagaturonate epimerase family protein [Lentilactobacillus diolivorans]MDH5104534.1 tagaturonate epimerase family protein [Lentilactobacillus diolivorans]